MNFDDSQGWLIGEVNGGLKCMFTMMNHARLWVGLQGLAQCERGWQASLAYARERRQGRTSEGGKGAGRSHHRAPGRAPHAADPEIARRKRRAYSSGTRACRWTARCIIRTPRRASEAEALLSLLTPVVKGFVTGMSLECTSDAMQIHGGHGYVSETGVEQFFRDARITAIYEGANGVQAMDLLGRKVLGSGGALARAARRPDRRLLRASFGLRRARRIRRAPGRAPEGMERGDRGSRAPRGAQSRRDRRGLDGLPAAHRLPLPRLVLGLDGVGLGCGAEGGQLRALRSTARSSLPRASTSSASCRAPRRTSTRWARARAR